MTIGITGDETVPSLLLDRYRVEAQQDEGNLGIVMRAYDTQHERQVEIHAPRRDAITTDIAQTRERFANESEARVRIGTRDDIVAVLDLASDANDTPYLILEYVAGGTLAARLKRGGALPLPEAVTVTRNVARALLAAHEAGIVHRDVRPATIYLAADAHAKLGGFAFAQIENSARPEAVMPVQPDTSQYRAPEQEHTTEAARPASDQYSLGLVFFEMLIGVAFKELEPNEAWARVAWQPPTVFACLKRMTMDNPAERYGSMTAVIEALDRIVYVQTNDAALPATAVVPALSPSAAAALVGELQAVSSPALPEAAVKEMRAAPLTTASLPVVAAARPPAPLPLRRTSRRVPARAGGLILIALLSAFLLARGAGLGSRSSPVATATVVTSNAGGVASATSAPASTLSAFSTSVTQPTLTALIGAATASIIRPTTLSPVTGGSATTPTALPVSPVVMPSVPPVPPTLPATGMVIPTVTRVMPGGTVSTAAATVSAPIATRAPEATMTAMPAPAMPTAPVVPAVPVVPAPPPAAPTMLPATSTAIPTSTPLPPTPTPVPPSPTPVPPPAPLTLGIQSVGTTNQPLTAIEPQDSVVQFVAGQEVFGWINYGGAVVGQDSLDATVLAGRATVATRQVDLMQPEGFAVFSFGPLPAGQYTLQVRYQGNVVRESTFTVAMGGAVPVQPRVVATAPRAAAAAPVAPTVPQVAEPPMAPATAAPIMVVAPPVVMAAAPQPTTAPVAVIAPTPAVPTVAPPVRPVAPPMVTVTPPPRND